MDAIEQEFEDIIHSISPEELMQRPADALEAFDSPRTDLQERMLSPAAQRKNLAAYARLMREHVGWVGFGPENNYKFKETIVRFWRDIPPDIPGEQSGYRSAADFMGSVHRTTRPYILDNHNGLFTGGGYDHKAVGKNLRDVDVGSNFMLREERPAGYTRYGSFSERDRPLWEIGALEQNGKRTLVVSLPSVFRGNGSYDDWADFIETFDSCYGENGAGWDKIVLDVRGDAGGEDKPIDHIARRTYGNNVNGYKRCEINDTALSHWIYGHHGNFRHNPIPDRSHFTGQVRPLFDETGVYYAFDESAGYRGTIDVLIDGRTGSAAESAHTLFYHHPKVRYIGANTRGMQQFQQGNVHLPCGFIKRVGVTKLTYWDDENIETIGHKPDIYTHGQDAFDVAMTDETPAQKHVLNEPIKGKIIETSPEPYNPRQIETRKSYSPKAVVQALKDMEAQNTMADLTGTLKTTYTPIGRTQAAPNFSITLRPSSAKETFQTLSYSLDNISWYKTNGYRATAEYLENLLETNKIPGLKENSFSDFQRFYYSDEGRLLFDENSETFKTIDHFFEEKLDDISVSFEQMSKSGLDFKVRDNYQILFNPIDCNGKYDFPNRVILAGAMGKTNAGTLFHTAVHEMVHLGIQDSVVKRLDLNHLEKERVVDCLCNNIFKNKHFQDVAKSASYMDGICKQLLESGHLSDDVIEEIIQRKRMMNKLQKINPESRILGTGKLAQDAKEIMDLLDNELPANSYLSKSYLDFYLMHNPDLDKATRMEIEKAKAWFDKSPEAKAAYADVQSNPTLENIREKGVANCGELADAVTPALQKKGYHVYRTTVSFPHPKTGEAAQHVLLLYAQNPIAGSEDVAKKGVFAFDPWQRAAMPADEFMTDFKGKVKASELSLKLHKRGGVVQGVAEASQEQAEKAGTKATTHIAANATGKAVSKKSGGIIGALAKANAAYDTAFDTAVEKTAKVLNDSAVGKAYEKAATAVSESKAGQVVGKVVDKAATAVASTKPAKAVAKVAAKATGTAVGKSLLKKIPLVSLGAGCYFAYDRFKNGEWFAGCAEITSGALGCIPGLGTAASTAIDVGLAGKDITAAVQGDNDSEPAGTKEETEVVQNSITENEKPTNNTGDKKLASTGKCITNKDEKSGNANNNFLLNRKNGRSC